MRQILSSLIRSGKVVTTLKRAKVLKSQADAFFARLIKMTKMYKDEKDAKRECIRYVKAEIYGEEDGKKVIEVLLPKYKEAGLTSSFVADYKVGTRVGDAAPKVMIKLI